MTVNEYVTMDLILPLAGGLAGAALYHLLGPMLRGCIAAARFAFFLFGWALEAATGDHEDARAFAWRCVYEKRSPEPDTAANTRLRNIQSELVGLACHAAKVNVRITAMEERVGAIEKKTDLLAVYDPNHRELFCDVDPSSHYGDGCVKTSGVPYIAYGSTRATTGGKPCPKPTKDLRPGDEVSVSVKVGAVRLSRLYNSEGREETVFSLDAPTSVRADALDKLRTDNK